MESDSSMIQSLVCDTCWDTVFSTEGWQTVLAGEQVSGHNGFSSGFSYKTNWSAIQIAAANGCNWCRLLTKPKSRQGGEYEVEVWAACDEDSDCTLGGEKMLRIVVDRSKSPDAPFYCQTRTGAKTVSGYGSHNQYYMYTSQDILLNSAFRRFVAARERITDVSSPESYQLALECLNHCIRTHHGCPPPQADVFLPDRVIDCFNPRKPKIVLTGGKHQGHYVTLSYVWGGPQPLTTTQNIDNYVNEGMDMSNFPQTIQDADSMKDKERQLGQMRYIYRNAFLTINVACASSSQEGFLARDRPQRYSNARIPYRCPDGKVGSVWIAKAHDFDPDNNRSYWEELEPAAYRGWCLQEKMLPPRSLVYASDTLKFHCQTETANIGHALCEPSTGRRLPGIIYQPRGPGGSDTPLSKEEQVAYRQAWLAVLFMYTVREISVPSDKLIALAGVAEQFHLVYHDEYLAGLWRRTLLLDLLWATQVATRRHPRPEKYRAPSWSWASINGIVGTKYLEATLGSMPSIRQAEILDCRVTLASEEAPFGEVREGILKLKGFKQEVALQSDTVGAVHLAKPGTYRHRIYGS
ncbi:hypothetical protein CONPUDRAFT_141780 [Coniophora puteana RWD-64-598 SS2]|uniref:Heterokaryon incompatibility domain-containing protein n=1 Tax=Coniophora puteana (strain RWD-64-598) TaxID=741705 RepID=A0A5M3N0V0_CONPW|nr:uncharacterized protein CONPUDRAFT_141780 [Coniophora puteana RWD-64-598 SS2]EIW85019.1 hypothetical protein CONPUDRAFT_141780 [Coniophora puteana RWD-64-598 SS2]